MAAEGKWENGCWHGTGWLAQHTNATRPAAPLPSLRHGPLEIRLPTLREGEAMLDRLVAVASQLAIIVIAVVLVLAYANGWG